MAAGTIDRYEILKELGRGGMASVFLARDPRFGRDVAVKVLPAQFTHDPQFRKRFEREAKTIAGLDHAAIVPVHDFGEFEGQPYLVMRHMAGGSLAERIPKKGLPLEDVLPILLRIAPALDKAHQNGVIHRDLKPGNILFDSDDKAYIADFGVVKLTEASASLTRGVIGTPEYMSPEQGEGKAKLDGRSDVYALGVIVYQLLAGKLPYQADTPMSVIYAHIHEPLPDIRAVKPDLPKGIQAVLEKALAKKRGERYPNARAFALALAGAASTTVPKAAEMLAEAPETEIVAVEQDKVHEVVAAQPAAPGTERIEERETPPRKLSIPRWGWLAGGGALVLALLVFMLRNGGFPATLAGETPTATPTLSAAPATAVPVAAGRERIAFTSHRDGNFEIYVMDTDGGSQTRLTENDATDFNPAWSPDGSRIAFVSDRDGENEIYVMDADGSGEPQQLTVNSDDDNDPAWSPDGSQIVFRSNRDENVEIYVMDADGGSQTRLTDNRDVDYEPEWSPDGSQIAFTSNRDGNFEIYVMESDGSSPIRLTNDSAVDSQPAWAPDGLRIAFASFRDGNFEIYTMLVDGTFQNRLTNNGVDDQFTAWAPDGSRIAFQSERDGNVEIYVMDSDGGNQTRLTENDTGDFAPAWSPVAVQAFDDAADGESGSRILFVSGRDGNSEIYLMNADGSDPVNLTNHIGEDSDPQWSPDGSRILFKSSRDGGKDVFVMNADGSEITNLTNPFFDDEAFPIWSPDSSRILFSKDLDGDRDIFTIEVDSGRLTNLTDNNVDDFDPEWSPDGSQIAFGSRTSGNPDLYVIDAGGGSPVRLTNNAASEGGPIWSPDGSRIAYLVFLSITSPLDPPGYRIGLVDPDGSNRVEHNLGGGFPPNFTWLPDGSHVKIELVAFDGLVTYLVDALSNDLLDVSEEFEFDGIYSPDGSRIAYTTSVDGVRLISVAAQDGGNETTLAEINRDISSLQWSPDGGYILFLSGEESEAEIFVVDVQSGDLLQLTENEVEESSPSWSP